MRAKALLAEIERLSREASANSGDIDAAAVAEMIDGALDDLSCRHVLLLYLSAYLSRCLTGVIPDWQAWIPPGL